MLLRPSHNKLDSMTDSEILALRFSELPIAIKNSMIAPAISQVMAELKNQGLRIKPKFWFATEWFCPDGINGIAIPFYLAHPKLFALEKKIMGMVDGRNFTEWLKILRHELGHVIDNGYALRRYRSRQQLFGASSIIYPKKYDYLPYSRQYVQHLSDGYAQSHPAEDFAETFAVWLNPDSNWRTRYAGWGALQKLLFVETLMTKLKGQKPLLNDYSVIEPLSDNAQTLAQHYAKRLKQKTHLTDEEWNADLLNLQTIAANATVPASFFMRKHKRELCKHTANATGLPQYRIKQLLNFLVSRAKALNINLPHDEAYTKSKLSHYLATKVHQFIRDERHLIDV